MHDPQTVAFEIRYPWLKYGRKARKGVAGGLGDFERTYRASFITIWHVDPERDGSDDSCGWFKRARHGDRASLEQIRKDFDFEWDPDYGGWFHKDGSPAMSTIAIVIAMVRRAAWTHFGKKWKPVDRFLKSHFLQIVEFAENATDSMHPMISGKYGFGRREDRIAESASIVYGCILRWEQPWYKHPRYHFWHWRLQVHPWQTFRRWALTRCASCGKRFLWGYSPVSYQWDSPKPKFLRGEVGLYHSDCRHPADTAGPVCASVDEERA